MGPGAANEKKSPAPSAQHVKKTLLSDFGAEILIIAIEIIRFYDGPFIFDLFCVGCLPLPHVLDTFQ